MLARAFLLLVALTVPLAAQDVQGLVQPFKTVVISSPVLQEVIQKMAVEEGDSVKESQILFELRHSKEELQVREAEQIVTNAEFIASGLQRLADQNMGSKEQALKAKTELELARIRLALAKELRDEKTVKSPLNGIVVKKYKESGESIDRAEKVLEIVDIDRLYAQFYLDPKFLQTLKVEDPITIRISQMKGMAITGKITFIDPRIDATSGLFRVKVLFDNADRKIKAGMNALADFSKKG